MTHSPSSRSTDSGAVPFVSVHADGAKVYSGPGAGNYLTMARAAQAARDILDEASFKRDGLVMAHGTGTPQNRSSESAIFSTVAQALLVDDWRVSAIKATGHSLDAAAGDQMSALLVFGSQVGCRVSDRSISWPMML